MRLQGPSPWRPRPPQPAVRSLKEVAPCLIEGGLGSVVPSGSERVKDTANDLPGPTQALRGHPYQCAAVAREILVSVDVAVPLAEIGSVLVTLLFDNDLESHVDKIDSADRPLIGADDEIALGCRQTRQHQAQSEPGLPRRVDPLSN
jgi:hypothetical protein